MGGKDGWSLEILSLPISALLAYLLIEKAWPVGFQEIPAGVGAEARGHVWRKVALKI